MNNTSKTDFLQVTTTVPDQELARQIGQRLVETRLAACVQISGPVRSVYHWQGKIESADEFHCTAKIRASRLEDVTVAITQLHSYEVPEIIAMPLPYISDPYRTWLDAELA